MTTRAPTTASAPDASASRTTRVLIVDDHELLRDGLRMMMGNQPGLAICGEAADEDEALRQVRDVHPDFVVVDIGLKSGNGIDLIKQIKAHDPAVQIVVYSMHDERLYGERALRAGANGYVNKQDPARTILEAIRRVLAHKVYFSEELIERVLRSARGGETLLRSPVESLSDRELDVLRLIGQGLTTGEIGRQLHLSTNTVNTYRERLKDKLNVKTGAELTHWATQWVLENP